VRVQRHVHHAAGLHLEVGGGEETLGEGQEVLEGRYPLVIYRDFNGDLMGFYSDFLWDLIVIQWDIHGIYPLVNLRSYGKSPFLMGKSTINNHFQ
jgi:hypothetical protein